MGPGYFPRALGILLIVARPDPRRCARARCSGTPIVLPRRTSRCSSSSAAWCVFGARRRRTLGLVVATVLLVVVSSAASDEFRWKEAVISSLMLAAFTVVAFALRA